MTGNLFHDNQSEDLFVEVDHGPFLVDNNIFLSMRTLLSVSQGGAYVHNLLAGELVSHPFDARMTPYHKPHSTELAGMHNNPCGDDRYYNNIFVGRANLEFYDKAALPVWMSGNVFLKGARPSQHEADPIVMPETDPGLRLIEKEGVFSLTLTLDKEWKGPKKRQMVTTEILGQAAIPKASYEKPDGTPLNINTDYFGKPRNDSNPTPGPFESLKRGPVTLKVF